MNKITLQSVPYNFLDGGSYWRYGKQFKYQFLSEKQSLYDLRKKNLRSSPFHFLDFKQGELHVIHGERDYIVPASQFNVLKSKLIGDTNRFYLTLIMDWDFVMRLETAIK